MNTYPESASRLKEDITTYVLWLTSLLAIDQATKFWVRSHMSPGEFRILLPNVLELRYVENTGIAFGLLQGFGIWLAPIAVIVAVVATFAYFKASSHDRLFRSAMILISAGALGNFLDRVFLNGRVTDFIDIQLIHVFNLADVSITGAVVLLLVRGVAEEWNSLRRKGSPTPASPLQEPAPDPQRGNPTENPAPHPQAPPEEPSHPAP
jgi:signal peptidase II